MLTKGLSNKLLVIAIILIGLYVGKDLIIPFVIAIVVWYLLNSLGNLFGHIKIKKRHMPRSLQLFMGFMLFLIVSFFITRVVVSNFETFSLEYPSYHANFLSLTKHLHDQYDIALLSEEYFESIDLPGLFAEAIDSSLGFVATIFLILLYVIFLLLEQQLFHSKIRSIFKDRNEYVRFLGVVRKIDDSVHAYVSIKTSLCLLGAILSYLVLIIIGVDFAFLWAFLIFMFNFIPIIGAFLGVIFPSLIALLQFGTYLEPILVVSLLAGIQLVIGNFIEPKMLGSKLNLSPLVVILALSFWGVLWGMAGMFLCVPITVIMMIILSQIEGGKTISILLSGGHR